MWVPIIWLVAGTVSLATPWTVHYMEGFFSDNPATHHGYVTAYFSGIGLSVLTIICTLWRMSQNNLKPKAHKITAIAFILGVLALPSEAWVFLLGMM